MHVCPAELVFLARLCESRFSLESPLPEDLGCASLNLCRNHQSKTSSAIARAVMEALMPNKTPIENFDFLLDLQPCAPKTIF